MSSRRRVIVWPLAALVVARKLPISPTERPGWPSIEISAGRLWIIKRVRRESWPLLDCLCFAGLPACLLSKGRRLCSRCCCFASNKWLSICQLIGFCANRAERDFTTSRRACAPISGRRAAKPCCATAATATAQATDSFERSWLSNKFRAPIYHAGANSLALAEAKSGQLAALKSRCCATTVVVLFEANRCCRSRNTVAGPAFVCSR